MNSVAKTFIIFGLVLIGVGIFWQIFGKSLPFGRLPGDISIRRENFSFHFPIVTCLVISAILSLVMYLFRNSSK